MNLRMFANIAHKVGAVPIFMPQPRLASSDNDAASKKRILYDLVSMSHDSLLRAFDIADNIIQKVAEQEGAQIIDVRDEMNGRKKYFSDHVHLTQKGTERLAKVVANKLENILRAAKK